MEYTRCFDTTHFQSLVSIYFGSDDLPQETASCVHVKNIGAVEYHLMNRNTKALILSDLTCSNSFQKASPRFFIPGHLVLCREMESSRTIKHKDLLHHMTNTFLILWAYSEITNVVFKIDKEPVG